MKFNMIVLMTSCDPKRALRIPGMPPQMPPATTAAAQQSGSSTTAGRPASSIPTQAVANAAT